MFHSSANHPGSPASRHFSIRRTGSGGSQQQHHHHHHHLHHHHQTIIHQKTSMESSESRHTLYELVEISKSSSSTIRTSSTITNYKYTTTTAPAAATTAPLLAATQPKPLHCCQQQQQLQPVQHPAPLTASLAESAECLSAGKLQRNCQLMRQHSTISGGGGMRASTAGSSAAAAAGAANDSKRMPIRISTSKRESKAAKTLSTVVGGFIACWLPFFVYYLLIPFLPRAQHSDIGMTVLTWLGWVNSAINPFIYAFYNSDFRLAFWRLTFRKFCKGSPDRNRWH